MLTMIYCGHPQITNKAKPLLQEVTYDVKAYSSVVKFYLFSGYFAKTTVTFKLSNLLCNSVATTIQYISICSA